VELGCSPFLLCFHFNFKHIDCLKHVMNKVKIIMWRYPLLVLAVMSKEWCNRSFVKCIQDEVEYQKKLKMMVIADE
jgi:hypothetical protein